MVKVKRTYLKSKKGGQGAGGQKRIKFNYQNLQYAKAMETKTCFIYGEQGHVKRDCPHLGHMGTFSEGYGGFHYQ